jgi:Sulfotransferase domain
VTQRTIAGVSATRLDVIIAGVNKAGTTSLFVSLSEHPEVAPSAVKETRYFTPARYGRPVEPPAVYEGYFSEAGGRPVRLEATPSYFYGGGPLARLIDETLPEPRIIVVLREPVARTISFFQYQKTRLRIPPELSIEDYLAHADTLGPADFLDPENERWFAVGGSRYADFVPAWVEQFGPDRLLVLSFEELTDDPDRVLRETASWLGLDPARLPVESLASENRTTAYKSRRFQRLALTVNDRFERVFRRHPAVKRRMRSLYLRFNGRAAKGQVSDDVRRELAARFREPNERLAAQLRSAGLALPAWLSESRPVGTP